MIQLFDTQLIILLCIPSFLIGLSRGGLGGGFGLAAAIFTAQLISVFITNSCRIRPIVNFYLQKLHLLEKSNSTYPRCNSWYNYYIFSH